MYALLLLACAGEPPDKNDSSPPRADSDTDRVESQAPDTDTGRDSGAAPAPLWSATSLADADARLDGADPGEDAGHWMGPAGDLTGDGRSDLTIGAHLSDVSGEDAGVVYVQTGQVSGPSSLAGAHATLFGEQAGDHFGKACNGVGDTDGDGHDDLLVGAYWEPSAGYRAGAAYLFLGPTTGPLLAASATAKLLAEAPEDYAGMTVGPAGDVNADGYADLLIGAINEGTRGDDAGAGYLVLSPVTGTRSLTEAHARLLGEAAGDYAGRIWSAGDVNADGAPDLVVGAFKHAAGGPDAGAAYVVLGPVAGDLVLGDADGKWVGSPGAQAGILVAGGTDVDGDGQDDVLVGAPYHDVGGAAFLLTNPASGLQNLTDAPSVQSESAGARLGDSVALPGDVDGDGFADLLIGAPGAEAAYLVRGPTVGVVAATWAAAVIGDSAGDWVAGAGDTDGDGFFDLLVSAPGHDAGGTDAGAVYLWRGGK